MGQFRRRATSFSSDANDGHVVPPLMRRLPRASDEPPGAARPRASAIMPSTWGRREAVRGLPFLHAAQSFLHRAQHRRHGRPRSTSPPWSASQTVDPGEAPSSWHGGRTMPGAGGWYDKGDSDVSRSACFMTVLLPPLLREKTV